MFPGPADDAAQQLEQSAWRFAARFRGATVAGDVLDSAQHDRRVAFEGGAASLACFGQQPASSAAASQTSAAVAA